MMKTCVLFSFGDSELEEWSYDMAWNLILLEVSKGRNDSYLNDDI